MIFKNIPQISCPIFSQWQLEDALHTMDECYFTTEHPDLLHGFFGPGGWYGKEWWAWDYSLTINGVKWIDFKLAEDFIDNMCHGQKPDGRIKLYGADQFGHIPNVQEEISGSPTYLITIYNVAEACENDETAKKAYQLMAGALGWWFEKRQNKETGLITTIFEEGSPNNDISPSGVYSPMDANIFVANGSLGAAKLAQRFGDEENAVYFREKGEEIIRAMGKYMWCEEDGCYYPYVQTLKSQYKILLASTFHGFYLPGKERHERLVSLLTDTHVFNWDFIPLTTAAITDPLFATTDGKYISGSVCHRGGIWPYANHYAVKALRAAGYEELAATLMQKTVNTFAGRYTEFIHPFNNSQNGEARYAVTAALCLQLVIEDLFGLSYTKKEGLKLNPCLPACCKNANMWLKGIILPNGEKINVYIDKGEVRVEKEV